MSEPITPLKRHASRDREARAPSPYEHLRVSGRIRGVIIAYGIGALSLLFARATGDSAAIAPRQVLYMVLTGLGIQALLLVVRALTARYERAMGLEAYLSPLVIFVFELVADAVTVFLFALATYQGILQFANAV